MKNKKFMTTTAIILALGLSAAGFYKYSYQAQANEPAPEGQGEQQAMPVQVTKVAMEQVQIWKDFSGRVAAVDYAELRPQVSGNIVDIRFKDGQQVEKDDILYVIDPRPYEADVEKAKALLAAAENQYALAEKEFKRAQGLIKTKAISERVFDERANAAKIAKASVDGAKAELIDAQINLDYAYIKAPFAGRASRAEITIGNLVESGPNAPVLTSVISSEGMYADFEVDEQTYLEHVRLHAKDNSAEKSIPVRMSVGNDDHLYEGFIQSFDNRIDPASGTIRARALFANEDGALLPGMFARIQMGSSKMTENILITERAIGTNQDRKFVYILGENNIVTYREVKVGESIEGKRIINNGLKPGDVVITEGLLRVFPGMPVSPQFEG